MQILTVVFMYFEDFAAMAEGGSPFDPSASSHEWELSKENVQPIKQGREVTKMNAALQPNVAEKSARLRDERW